MTDFDGFIVTPLHQDDGDTSIALATFKAYGTLRTVECWDVDMPDGDVAPFPKVAQCRDDRTIAIASAIRTNT